MAESALDRIEEATGHAMRDGETVGEYVRRVGEQAGVEGEMTERTVEEFNRAAFSPDVTPEGTVVESFVEAVSTLDDDYPHEEGHTPEDAGDETEGDDGGPGSREGDPPNAGERADPSPGDVNGEDTVASPREDGDGSSGPVDDHGDETRKTGAATDVDTPDPSPAPSGNDGSSPGTGTSAEAVIPEDPFSSGGAGGNYVSKVKSATRKKFGYANEHLPFDGRDYYFLCTIVALGVYVFVRSLGQGTLSFLDEPAHADVASNMVYHGDYLIPHGYWDALVLGQADGYHPFLRKPPMTMWLQAAAMHVFGVTEFAARFPSAVAAILTGVVLYLFGRDLRNPRVGLFSAATFFTTAGYYATAHGGRAATDDALHTFAGVAFIYVTWKMAVDGRDERWVYSVLGVVAGVAVMIKGLAAVIFVIAVIPMVTLSWDRFASRKFLRTVAITAVLVVPWGVYAYVSQGDLFLEQMFFEEVFNRASGRRVTHEGALFEFMQYPYFRHLPMLFDPWSFYLLPAVGYLSATLVPDRSGRDLVNFGILGWWFGSILLFFAVAGNNSWYVMPVYPAGALLVAWTVDDAIRGRALATVAVVVGSVSALVFSFRVAELSPFALPDPSPIYGHGVTSGWLFVGLFAVATVLVVGAPLLRRPLSLPDGTRESIGMWAPILLSILLVASFTLTPPAFDGYESQKQLGTELDDQIDDETLYVDPVVIEEPHITTAYYMGDVELQLRPIKDLRNDPDVRYALIVRDRYTGMDRPHDSRYVSAPNDLVVVRYDD